METSGGRAMVACMIVVFLMQTLAAGGVGAHGTAHSQPLLVTGNEHFERTWARTDKPVADGQVGRTWMWGPKPFTDVLFEEYVEGPDGRREVQYFDKSRMEITDPHAEPASAWYVTNGLLVVELITGKLQIGDNSFGPTGAVGAPRSPAMVNVAGDPDDTGGPTYATFTTLLDAEPLPVDDIITQRVNRAGDVSDDPSLGEEYGVTALLLDEVTNHTIAAPFWEFMYSGGLVFEDGLLVEDLLFESPYYATGRPIIEPYWAAVKVDGTIQDVLVQCFERRCLTFTPGNEPNWRVEAGNVGQHYYRWRYETQEPPPPAGHLIINELLHWPGDGEPAWIEIFKPTPDPVDLGGWVITNDAGTNQVALPNWIMLAEAGYLVVYFGDGENDADFSDGSGRYYAGSGSASFFTSGADGVALYDGLPSPDTVVDYLAWSYAEDYDPGVAHDHAVAAGIWDDGAFYSASGQAAFEPSAETTTLLSALPGDSIGRDQFGADTDSPDDWDVIGGRSALTNTPGRANFTDISQALAPPPAGAPAGPDEQRALAQALPKKKWTVMVFMDGRDLNLYQFWHREINEMEKSGSGLDVNIVVQLMVPFTVTDAAQPPNPNQPSAYRFYLEQENTDNIQNAKEVIQDPAKVNPGDPKVLQAFISWAKTNYPADKYAIVLAGHGDGWKGTMLMSPEQDFLTMSELSEGLGALGQKFEAALFESCLMGQVEVGHQIAQRATMMVASEEVCFANTFPWKSFIDELKKHLDWSARQFADEAATQHAAAMHKLTKGGGIASLIYELYTVSSIDLAVVEGELAAAVDELAKQMEWDIDAIIKEREQPKDNAQILIKHDALEKAENFVDRNFIDLQHFAELVKTLGIPASVFAQAVIDKVDKAVTVHQHGLLNRHAYGLSIYFPHDQLLPHSERKSLLLAIDWGKAFDNPLHDPNQPLPTKGTHLYKRDAKILIPRLAGENHSMADAPDFLFPKDTHWDEMLHRYYKPVADACIRKGGKCVKETTLLVGETVKLSGIGSSDSDGPEDTGLGGSGNDVPAHATTPTKHYYWDFDTTTDSGGAKPDYKEGVLYAACDGEDCDLDDIDETNDDRDATGELVDYTCLAPGEYTIRLVVWDEHHDEQRVRHEDEAHNEGRHWLHFNVDDDTVKIKCVIEPHIPRIPPYKKSDRPSVPPGGHIQYTITLFGHPELTEPAQAWISDPLPDLVQYLGDAVCSVGTCGYDAETNAVSWMGTLDAGQMVVLRFSIAVGDEGTPEVPPDIENCALTFDGLVSETVCVTTDVEHDQDEPPPPPHEPARHAPGRSWRFAA